MRLHYGGTITCDISLIYRYTSISFPYLFHCKNICPISYSLSLKLITYQTVDTWLFVIWITRDPCTQSESNGQIVFESAKNTKLCENRNRNLNNHRSTKESTILITIVSIPALNRSNKMSASMRSQMRKVHEWLVAQSRGLCVRRIIVREIVFRGIKHVKRLATCSLEGRHANDRRPCVSNSL